MKRPQHIHQLVHSFVDHDAISSHVRHTQRVIREMGLESNVYATEWRGKRSHASAYQEMPAAAPDDIVLYHLSTASGIANYLHARPEQLGIVYHNSTPFEYLEAWEPSVAPELKITREQLGDLAPRTKWGIGVSQYNADEMEGYGFEHRKVAPILFDAADFDREIDQKTDDMLSQVRAGGGNNWLFVGRVTPHKCQHEIVKALWVHRNVYGADSRLHIVGGLSSHRYWSVLNQYIEVLGLADVVDVTMGVDNATLGAYYKNADVFVCLSEHEGFGVPLLEAMHAGAPVVAYDAAAVGETLGSGGLLLDDKSPAVVAAAIDRVLNDDALNKSLRAAGGRRLADFSLAAAEAQWRALFEEMIEER